MKKLVTVGEKYYNGYELLMCLEKGNFINAEAGFRERFKIIFIEEGGGILRIEDRRHLFFAPTIFCFNENDYYQLENESGLKIETLWFHPQIINNTFDFNKVRQSDTELMGTEVQDAFWLDVFTRRQKGFNYQLNVGPSTAKRVKNLFKSIEIELLEQNDIHWPCRSRTFLIELLFLLARIASEPDTPESITISIDSGDIGDILIYLYSNYMNRITIDDLTERFHINRTTLNKLFNRVTGMPVMKYVIKLRLYLASQMLNDTLLPVQEVISRTGFNDPTHFGREFKKNYGYSPTEYRNKNCWMLR